MIKYDFLIALILVSLLYSCVTIQDTMISTNKIFNIDTINISFEADEKLNLLNSTATSSNPLNVCIYQINDKKSFEKILKQDISFNNIFKYDMLNKDKKMLVKKSDFFTISKGQKEKKSIKYIDNATYIVIAARFYNNLKRDNFVKIVPIKEPKCEQDNLSKSERHLKRNFYKYCPLEYKVRFGSFQIEEINIQ